MSDFNEIWTDDDDDADDVVGKGLTEANDDKSAVAFEGSDRQIEIEILKQDFTLC